LVRLLKWTAPVLVLLILVTFLLRDRLFVALLQWEQAEKRERAAERIQLPSLPAELRDTLARYLVRNGQPPVAYVLEKFARYDLVFLGEYHRIRHDVEFVQRLIPLLPTVGVHTLGFEFACHRDQAMVDELLAKPEFDEELARRILFKLSPAWGYREYLDVFRAGWTANRNRSVSEPPFRIIALSRIMDWSHIKTEADRADKELMKKVFPEGDGDTVMTREVIEEIVERNQKALIFCGIHHAFTRFRQPIWNQENGQVDGFCQTRLGNRLYERLGARTCTIFLHSPWISSAGFESRPVYPVDGIIDALMQVEGERFGPVGFDTCGTPFGQLPGETSLYSLGQEKFRLADFCDGYIFFRPLSETAGVRWIQDFIHTGNIEETRAQLPNPRLKNGILNWLGPYTFNYLFASDADMELRFRHLH
jgi:hypothetical protein